MSEERWERVKVPRRWNPQQGEALVGEYLGTSEGSGRFGKYVVQMLRDDEGQPWYVSGKAINDAFQVAKIVPGVRLRLVCTRVREEKTKSGATVTCREWDIFTAVVAPEVPA